MPMGIVSDTEFDSELDNLTPCPPKPLGKGIGIVPTAIIQDSEIKGRGEGNVEVPEGLRKLIGQESITNGRESALELADKFGVSPSSVSAYTQGAHSTASYDNRPDLTTINGAKERIAKRARHKLHLAFNSLTKEKIEAAKAKDIAGVAKDMSAIIRNMEPDTPKLNGSNGPTFIFYSPQMRSEKVFDVVRVKE